MRGAALICMLLAGLAILPGAALAQSAGDEQYFDPFQDPQGGGQGGGGGGQGTGGGESTQPDTGAAPETGTVEPAPPAEPAAPAEPAPPSEEGGGFGASASGAPGSGSAVLPRTGLPVALAAILGTVFLVGGVALRRRV
jgi:hypothetical protein